MEIIFKYIEEKHDEFYQKEIKMDLYYAMALDKDGEHLGEVNGHESYCEDCREKARKYFNKMLRKNRSELDINCSDEYVKLAKEIVMFCEGSPERDDFLNCEECGSLISVGVLHTFDQEIDHYLSEDTNLHIKHLTNDDCYRIHELFDSRYTEKIELLKQKIIKQNN
ncbi:hypothetical protein ACMGDK_11690 [Chryseobacterium sp. DT-3]|uniref:hypothetical protein n=1 Tax=Chryseobacterium sp. DT-3 TaxID=3396164 RepID=UPI003F1950F3